MYTGGAGGYSFYVRGGEQVVRQRKNNSNYGESASRSYAQMIRRIKWGNLVNVYKQIKSWQQKAYDDKLAGQTDYNIFIKLNINNTTVGTTRQANEQGFGVWEPYQVSNGSVPVIQYQADAANSRYHTNIVVKEAVLPTTTIGDFSADIIANNPQFRAGDNIAFVFFLNWQWSGVDWPYASSVYTEITLNPSDTRLLSDIADLGDRLTESLSDTLDVTYTPSAATDAGHEVGFACIHTRKESGVLKVSSQSIVLNDDSLVQQYSGSDWYDHCIESYGLDTEVPLDPNFKDGIISKVTANGATIANAASLTGSQTVRVYGNKLYGQGYELSYNGIVYVPLRSTDDFDEFILTANGSYVIRIDGQVFMSFSVSGITRPSDLSGLVIAQMLDADNNGIESTTQSTQSGCLNYPYKVSEDYPKTYCTFGFNTGATGDPSLVEYNNCTGNLVWSAELRRIYGQLTPTDDSEPMYVSYDGFIVFVGNY